MWFNDLGQPWLIHECFANDDHCRKVKKFHSNLSGRSNRVSTGIVMEVGTTQNRSFSRLMIQSGSDGDLNQDFGFVGHAPSVPGSLVAIGSNDEGVRWVRFWNPSFSIRNHVERALRIRFEGRDCGVLDTTVCRVIAELQDASGVVHGPIPLPSRYERYTLLASAGRAVCTIITHKRQFSLINPYQEVVAKLRVIELPPEVTVRMTENSKVVQHCAPM